jgi:hypothetical protein
MPTCVWARGVTHCRDQPVDKFQPGKCYLNARTCESDIGMMEETFQIRGADYYQAHPWGHSECQVLVPYLAKEKQLQDDILDLRKQTDSLGSQIESEQRAIVNKAKETAIYRMDTIRLTAKDADTKAVLCAANLNVKIDDDEAHMGITFQVENTTDGKLDATIYGLN